MASSFTSTIPFAAASHHPLPPACLSREAAMLLRRHLDFQRLLVATEAAAEQHRHQHQNETCVGSRQYQLELNRLLVFVRALREQLTELYGLADYNLGVGSGGGGGGGMDASPKALQGYGFRVDALERDLLARQQEVRRWRANQAAAEQQQRQQESSSQPGAASSEGGLQAAAVPQEGRGTPKEAAAGGKRVGGAAPATIVEEAPRLDRDSQAKVQKEEAAQQALKAQLEELVGSLKASTLLVHSSLRQQNEVLDKTDDAAQKNLAGLQAELRKTEEQLRRSWSNSLTSCVMIALMLAVFVATFLFMRLFPKKRWLLW